MSSTPWAETPTPVLATEQSHRILAGVIAAESPDRSVLRIFGLPEPAGFDAGHIQSPRPQIALKLYESLIEAVLASGVVYSLRTVRVADDFYIEYIPARRSLWLKYQQILGSRLLIQMTKEQAQLFEKTAQQLRAPEGAEDVGIHMWRFLRPGGVLVSLTSPGWRTGHTKAQPNFRAFVGNIGAEVKAFAAGAFKASGTKVSVLRLRAVEQVEGALAGFRAGQKA